MSTDTRVVHIYLTPSEVDRERFVIFPTEPLDEAVIIALCGGIEMDDVIGQSGRLCPDHEFSVMEAFEQIDGVSEVFADICAITVEVVHPMAWGLVRIYMQNAVADLLGLDKGNVVIHDLVTGT